MRYRIALALIGESGCRFVVFDRVEGLLPALEKRRPRWILLDAGSFEVELDAMLAKTVEWTRQNRGHAIVLARGADRDQATEWLRAGARDIILLDPSLREAMRRLRARVLHREE